MPERLNPRSLERARERQARRRRRVLRWLGGVVAAGILFFAGVAVGRVIERTPGDSDQTLVGTIVPTTVSPAQTVTVTVSKP
jgi:anti-sigma factor RsiW